MDKNALLELRARLWSAKVHNHQFAGAASYAEELEKQAGPVDFQGTKHSVDHLLALVEKAVHVLTAPPAPKIATKPPAKESTKVAVKPEPKSKASDSR